MLGEREEFRRKNNTTGLVKLKTTAEFIPLSRVLKKFFELPRMLQDTFNYVNQLSNQNLIMNFIQASYWQNRLQVLGSKMVLPIFYIF